MTPVTHVKQIFHLQKSILVWIFPMESEMSNPKDETLDFQVQNNGN